MYSDGLNLYWIYALLLNVCCTVIAWIEMSWLVSNILGHSKNQFSLKNAGFGKERLDVPVYSSLCVCVLCVIVLDTTLFLCCYFTHFRSKSGFQSDYHTNY